MHTIGKGFIILIFLYNTAFSRVGVFYFKIESEIERYPNLYKNISDMFITTLHYGYNVNIVDRYRCSRLHKYIHYNRKKSYGKEDLKRISRIFKWKYVITGNFWINEDGISLKVILYKKALNSIIYSKVYNGNNFFDIYDIVNRASNKLANIITRKRTLPFKKPILDIVFVVDMSGDARNEYYYLKEAFGKVLSSVINAGRDIKVGVVFFNDRGSKLHLKSLNPTDKMLIVRRFINNSVPSGGKDIKDDVGDALKKAYNMPWRANSKKIVILFCGSKEREFGLWSRVRNKYKKLGIKLYAILFKNGNNNIEIKKVAKYSGGKVIELPYNIVFKLPGRYIYFRYENRHLFSLQVGTYKQKRIIAPDIEFESIGHAIKYLKLTREYLKSKKYRIYPDIIIAFSKLFGISNKREVAIFIKSDGAIKGAYIPYKIISKIKIKKRYYIGCSFKRNYIKHDIDIDKVFFIAPDDRYIAEFYKITFRGVRRDIAFYESNGIAPFSAWFISGKINPINRPIVDIRD